MAGRGGRRRHLAHDQVPGRPRDGDAAPGAPCLAPSGPHTREDVEPPLHDRTDTHAVFYMLLPSPLPGCIRSVPPKPDAERALPRTTQQGRLSWGGIPERIPPLSAGCGLFAREGELSHRPPPPSFGGSSNFARVGEANPARRAARMVGPGVVAMARRINTLRQGAGDQVPLMSKSFLLSVPHLSW